MMLKKAEVALSEIMAADKKLTFSKGFTYGRLGSFSRTAKVSPMAADKKLGTQ